MILRQFICAERTGNWKLHMASSRSMLPYFASSGHNLYLKSVYVYLQNIIKLSETNPEVYPVRSVHGRIPYYSTDRSNVVRIVHRPCDRAVPYAVLENKWRLNARPRIYRKSTYSVAPVNARNTSNEQCNARIDTDFISNQ